MSKIIGNTVGTTMLRPDWAETDEKSSAYIGNKPTADDGNFLVGNGKGNLKEMTPSEVLSHINGASVSTLTTAEYDALVEAEETNANVLYVLTDTDEEEYALKSDLDNYVKTSDIPSVAGLASTDYVDTKVADIVNSAPETLNTLNELAAALGNDKDFATTVAQQIGEKADKEHEHSEYITETELAGKGYLTSIPDEYVTETELNNKKYLSEVKPKDVIFDYDIIVSHPIGSIKQEDFGDKPAITLETTGQSLEVVLRNIFGGELQPKITKQPSCSFTASGKHIGEVGEEIYPLPEATFSVTSVGEYTYDGSDCHKDTGVMFSGSITGGYETVEFTNLGHGDAASVYYGADKYIYTETPQKFEFSGQYGYNEGDMLKTNLGNETEVSISPAVSDVSISATSGTYTGYRKIFVGTMNSHMDSFTSEQIRQLKSRTYLDEEPYADGYTKRFDVFARRGTALVIAAFPVKYCSTVMFEYEINGGYTDVTADVTDCGEVDVEGANGYASETYHVYAYKSRNNSGAFSADITKFRITVR